jgi:hypothetical protein
VWMIVRLVVEVCHSIVKRMSCLWETVFAIRRQTADKESVGQCSAVEIRVTSVLFSVELGPALVQTIHGFLRSFHFRERDLETRGIAGDFLIFQCRAAG